MFLVLVVVVLWCRLRVCGVCSLGMLRRVPVCVFGACQVHRAIHNGALGTVFDKWRSALVMILVRQAKPE